MSKRYRRKKYNDDYLDLIGIAILGVITYIIKFIINNWEIIIYTAITIIIVIILIMNRKKLKKYMNIII